MDDHGKDAFRRDGLFPGLGTVAIHGGQQPDPLTGAVIPTLSLSTTYAQSSPGVHKGYEYARTNNPTRQTFEECMAALEGGRHGVAFSSGSAATTTIAHLLKEGDHIISVDDVYGGTHRYFLRVASVMGLRFTFAALVEPDELNQIIQPNTKMLWLETPTNPTLKIMDIRRLSDRAHEHGLIVVVDNTFMSPFFQSPLEYGADIVVHSVTKFINGHADVVMGVAVTSNNEIASKLRFLQNSIGAVPSPFDCYLAVRGLKTLHIRMQRHEQNATAVAKFLEAHPKVDRVIYPGLPSHPQHEIAKQQMRGFGGMVTFFIKGTLENSRCFLENLRLFANAESLGGVESLAEHPAIMTHASVPAEHRKKLGISDQLVRLSVGIEDVEDILTDLREALDKC